MNKAMIIIAVSRYTGDLIDLPGTLISASRLRGWAEKSEPHQSYKVLEISDRNGEDVTVDRVRAEVKAFINNNLIDRLLIYFAGHGIVATLSNQFWLLTNAASDRREGIDVEAFRQNLGAASIGANNRSLNAGQLILIGDACRNSDIFAARFQGDAIYTETRNQSKPLRQDRHFSSVFGDVSLHINQDGAEPPYCLFSQIIFEALSGGVAGLGDTAANGEWQLCNFDFADFIDSELPRRSKALTGKKCDADTYTLIRPAENIYSSVPQPVVASTTNTDELAPGADTLASVADAHIMSSALPTLIHANKWFEKNPQNFAKKYFRKLLRQENEQFLDIDTMQPATLRVQKRPKDLWVPGHLSQSVDIWKRFGSHNIRIRHSRGEPIIVRFKDDALLIPQYPNVIPFIIKKFSNDIFLKKISFLDKSQKIDSILSDEFNRKNQTILKIRDALIAGDEVRGGKHTYPHHSVAAAYLYEFAGDKDNIARTAHYMARDGMNGVQDESLRELAWGAPCVPFDLGLLCADKIVWERQADGGVMAFADLPKVEQRDESWNPRAVSERPSYASSSFKKQRRVPLWGACPIFRQGWSYLASSNNIEVDPALLKIASMIEGSTATLLSPAALEHFVEYFGYTSVIQ